MDNESKIPEWMQLENRQRTSSYSRDLGDEAFLREVNWILQPYESEIDAPGEPPYPIIFFFGVPRIGKTMFSQFLCKSLDVGFPDNLIARFWQAPTFGIRLSKIVNKGRVNTGFQSDIGKTQDISEPHDFSYFWHDWFKIDPTRPYDPDKARAKIDWDDFFTQLKRMSAAWGKTAVFKGVLASYHIQRLAEVYEKSFFIYIRRDYIDSALSFCKAKRDTFGNPDVWMGQVPPSEDYEALDSKPYPEKIAGHFKSLATLYERELSLIDPVRYMEVTYRDICSDPRAILQSITERLEECFGQRVELRQEPPESFKVSVHKEDEEDYSLLYEALIKYGLPPRL